MIYGKGFTGLNNYSTFENLNKGIVDAMTKLKPVYQGFEMGRTIHEQFGKTKVLADALAITSNPGLSHWFNKDLERILAIKQIQVPKPFLSSYNAWTNSLASFSSVLGDNSKSGSATIVTTIPEQTFAESIVHDIEVIQEGGYWDVTAELEELNLFAGELLDTVMAYGQVRTEEMAKHLAEKLTEIKPVLQRLKKWSGMFLTKEIVNNVIYDYLKDWFIAFKVWFVEYFGNPSDWF